MMKIENHEDWASMLGFLLWIDLELHQSMRSTRIYTTEKTVITAGSNSHYRLRILFRNFKIVGTNTAAEVEVLSCY